MEKANSLRVAGLASSIRRYFKFPVSCTVLGLLAVFSSTADAKDGVIVRNFGVGGANTQESLERLPGILKDRPDHLVIFLGVNDAIWARKRLPIATYRKNLETMVFQVREAAVDSVSLVTIHPINADYLLARHPDHPQGADLQTHLAQYDKVVREVAAATGAILIDWRAQFLEKSPGNSIEDAVSNRPDCLIRCEANSGAADGVHLTACGYRVLGEFVASSLRERIKSGDTVVCVGDSITYGSHMRGGGTATGDTFPAFLADALDEGSSSE